jgi:3-hydroxyisobutyrate dehydrogenase-like beta-hydroxyacid dehydrogenase
VTAPTPGAGGGVRVAVLGLGEAGSLIAADLVAAGADVRGYDPAVPAPPGVAARAGDADAVRDADLVLSLTAGHEARGALVAAGPALAPGTLWADLNTTSPGLKAELAASAGTAVDLVDVALMAPVPGHGLRTPMVAAGPAAARFAALLGRYGASVSVVDGPVGTAMSRKLLRSIVYKGLAAAVLEALDGARAAGCEDWLRDHLAAELAGFDAATLDRLVEGSHRHAARRTEEMAAAVAQLHELGLPARMSTAAGQLLAALSRRTA